MVQVYLAKGSSHFCSYYFDDYVSCLRNKPNLNDDTDNDPTVQSLSIFKQPGKGSKKRTLRKLTEKEEKNCIASCIVELSRSPILLRVRNLNM